MLAGLGIVVVFAVVALWCLGMLPAAFALLVALV
jgi:hypothetical protein